MFGRTNIILMYAIICYFLLDVRANQSGGTWVPWSIDSFEKYTRVLYICIISSHVRYNLLFSFGCSGEPVRRYVSSLKYRFLCKIHSCTLCICIYHLMYAIICYFLLDVRANQSGGTWVPWSIDSFEKYTRILYIIMHNIISCTLYLYFLLDVRANQPCGTWVPWSIDSFEKYIMYIISYHVIICYFLLDVRANQSGGTWVPWSIDSFEKYTRVLYIICIISSHVRYNLLFSFGCSGEPVRRYVSSLKYRFLWKIHSCTLYMHNIISCTL